MGYIILGGIVLVVVLMSVLKAGSDADDVMLGDKQYEEFLESFEGEK